MHRIERLFDVFPWVRVIERRLHGSHGCTNGHIIAVDDRLTPASRISTIAHELAHQITGTWPVPGTPEHARIERLTDRIAARWLIDSDELAACLAWTLIPGAVAEELHVDQHILSARLADLDHDEQTLVWAATAHHRDSA